MWSLLFKCQLTCYFVTKLVLLGYVLKILVHFLKLLCEIDVEFAASEYRIQNCKPDRIVGNFKKEIKNACSEVTPEVSYSGSFFHFYQSIYRKIQEVDLQQQYNNPKNREIKIVLNVLMTLSFISTPSI